MRRAIEFRVLPLCTVVLTAGSVHASGFHVDEQDARATGRAGAVVASPGGASAIYYNPAGVALTQGVNVDIGGSYVRPTAEFTSDQTGDVTHAETETFLLPQAYVTWRASQVVALGVGVNSSFGLALKWPASSPGRAEVREAELRTFFITPTFALNLSEWAPGFSVGAGVDLVPASVRLSRDILFGEDVADVVLGGNAFGIGGRVGLYYSPLPILSFGLTYRTPVALDFSGDADFDAPPQYRASLPPDGDVKTSVTLPQTLQVGIQVAPIPALQIELDGSWRGWSSYDQLDVELPDGTVQSTPRDWKDSLTLRLGAEYTFVERWSVRLGGIWDQTPVPADRLDFQLPDADRVDVTAGFGARITDRVSLDLAALYVLPQERATSRSDPLEPPVKGSFRIDAWVVGLTLGFQLDTPMARAEDPDDQLGDDGCRHAPEVRATAHLAPCSR
jgi:long-chain fatty acid transport protein